MRNATPPGTPGEARDRFAEAIAFHGHVCPGLAPLRARVMRGRATDAEQAGFHERVHHVVDAIMEMPAEELFTVREVDAEAPGRARRFRSVPCARCGEMTAESRVRVEDGELVCYSCSQEYSRHP